MLGAVLLISASTLEADPADSLVVNVNLVFDRSVSSGVTKSIARDEAAEIWNAYGVALRWADSAPGAALHLDVIVASEKEIEMRPGALSVLGRTYLQRDGTVREPIRINYDAILALCENRSSNGALLRERELGRALGRVLAHEIGHVLLGAPAYHDREGLMRVTLSLDDLILPDRTRVGLTDESVARLHSRVPCRRSARQRVRPLREVGRRGRLTYNWNALTRPAGDPFERVRQMCLSLPDAWEKLSHGEPTFWVGRKMFATCANAANHHGAGRHAVWCRAAHVTQDLLVTQSPDRYFKPPYVGPSGWVGVWLDRRPRWTEVALRLRHAYELALPERPSKPAKRSSRVRE
jgi:hypothetical protein